MVRHVLLLTALLTFQIGSLLAASQPVDDADGADVTADTDFNVTELECRFRRLALSYARQLQPWRNDSDVFQLVSDALQLDRVCLAVSDDEPAMNDAFRQHAQPELPPHNAPLCTKKYCIYVRLKSNGDDSWDGACVESESGGLCDFSTIGAALAQSRRWNRPTQTTIVVQAGIHFVGTEPLVLTSMDSGLTITGETNQTSWLSGSVPLSSTAHTVGWSWNEAHTMLTANLSTLFHTFGIKSSEPQPLRSLFGHNRRYVRARYPNAHPETDQWGYNTPTRYDHSIDPAHVVEWIKPPAHGDVPRFDYVDLRYSDTNDSMPMVRPTKNDSTMPNYNVYASGTSGVCTLWSDTVSSYWCSNASDGGWAEVDRACAVTGRLQLPVGLVYNASTELGRRISAWNQSAVGGMVHAWHSQSWATHMFRIQDHDTGRGDSNARAHLTFEPGGGKQGGRNWCRCDQCSYAAPWCGQRQDPPDHSDDRLISGTWMVENVVAELDAPGEYYFDETTHMLYIILNVTSSDRDESSLPQLELDSLRLSVVQQLVRVQDGARDITISNLGWRETAPTYMSDWIVPSGGDWSLHRGGALVLENVDNITIQDGTFSRLDGNAIFVSGRTRDVTIRRNQFEWLGESAIVLLGNTDGFNATRRDMPLHTVIESNVMRELGIYEKQSSAVFVSKAAQTLIQTNLMFNLPRAAINFNDMAGGGDIVGRNLIFNSCRESGDHGPINSWDRQPFLTDILQEGTPSFVPIRRRIVLNLIFANYGASQGVDNDDGSSWYHVQQNVFYSANGFKMDYGGHDSIYEDNLVVGYPHKGACVEFGSFYAGHEHVVRRNTCIAANGNQGMIQLEECRGDGTATLHDNRYYAPNAAATVQCGWQDPPIPFAEFQETYGLEQNSTLQATPQVRDIMMWALEVLFPFDVTLDMTATS